MKKWGISILGPHAEVVSFSEPALIQPVVDRSVLFLVVLHDDLSEELSPIRELVLGVLEARARLQVDLVTVLVFDLLEAPTRAFTQQIVSQVRGGSEGAFGSDSSLTY